VRGVRWGTGARGWLGKALALVTGTIVVAAAFLLSVVVVAVALAAALVGFGYLWWRTRALRRKLREQPAGGRVIEGEVIRDR
jgi:Flp pilus assembly protein TadB